MVNRYVNYIHGSRLSGKKLLSLGNAGGVMCPKLAMSTEKPAMSHSDDYQYLQKSKLNTMHFQRSLPRLPIPKLELTCERFLNAIQPIVTQQEFESTQQVVAAFREGAGKKLHELLINYDGQNKHTSYISEPWFDMYLSDRAPLPLNYNPLLVMRNEPRAEYKTQLVRATNLVVSSLRFWRSLQANLLEPEVFHLKPKKSDTEQYRKWMRLAPSQIATYLSYIFKAYPLDMSQYNRLFGVSRIPQVGKDVIVQNKTSKHILVMRKGNMYAVDVLDSNGLIEPANVILGRLQAVLDLDAKRTTPNSHPLGVLTSGNRNDWAVTREHLVTKVNASNKTQIDQVDSALFCVCLDGSEDPVYNKERPIPMLKHMLSGEAKNRWFDKSVSLIIADDGTTAVNFEHSWGDGVAVLRYFNEIFEETMKHPFVSTQTAATSNNSANAVREISIELDDRIKDDIQKAFVKNSKILNSLNMDILRYPHLNKRSCKRDKLGPDSIMQLSFQLAYRQAFGSYVGTYESCSTAAFKHGRTETMRPCTLETAAFCEAILKPENDRASPKELRQMIDACSTKHNELTKNAAMGQGFDRHLFSLKNTAIKNNLDIPELYDTKAYAKINHNIISTSTLSSNALEAGSFGPVVRDGLGIAYSIQNEECGAIVSTYDGCCDGTTFVSSLKEAFDKISEVIQKSK